MRAVSKWPLLAAALALPAAASLAQAPAKPPASDTEKPATQNDSARGPCASGNATVGSGDQLVTPNAKKGEALSDHLAQSNGVICPPPTVDQGIQTPPPGGGRTPVIKPPGTPGGAPGAQPK
jgi:hypothetical protein